MTKYIYIVLMLTLIYSTDSHYENSLHKLSSPVVSTHSYYFLAMIFKISVQFRHDEYKYLTFLQNTTCLSEEQIKDKKLISVTLTVFYRCLYAILTW